tara:strand:+ start:12186 stop:13175 length:990 start_codon:yes stop_codon:yes gene_type:complete
MPTMPHNPEDFRMAFGDHLEELRRRIIMGLLAPIPLAFIFFFLGDWLLLWLMAPLQHVQLAYGFSQQLQVLSPPEFLILKIKVSIIAALIFSLPWILWQGWLFIGPGLYPKERRFVHFLVPGSVVLTASGVCLMYFFMLPLMLEVLMVIGGSLETPPHLIQYEPDTAPTEGLGSLPLLTEEPLAPKPGDAWVMMPDGTLQIAVAEPELANTVRIIQLPMEGTNAIMQVFRLSSYINFVLVLLLGITVAFQMPLVIVLLGWLNIVNIQGLKKNRKWALLVCGILAAITTPADVMSMFLMLIPLYMLYELGILVLQLVPASRLTGNAEGRP